MPLYHLDAHRDEQAEVWWADSSDIPGFATEAETYDGLVSRAMEVIGELLAENGLPHDDIVVEFRRVESR